MNRQVLLLEDDPTIRRMVTTILTIKGYDVDSVERGDEALRQIAVCAYGVIIVDLMVPAYSGADVIEAVRVLYPALLDRIVVVTGASREARALLGTDRDIEVIEKPFDIDVLIEAVDRRAALDRNVVSLGSRAARSAALAALFAKDSESLHATAGILARFRESQLHPEAWFGYEPSMIEPYFPLPIDANFPIAISVREKRPLYFDTIDQAVREYPDLLPVWKQTGSRSLAAVPLCLAETPVGVIGWSWHEPTRFNGAHLRRMEGLSKRYELLMSAFNFAEGHQARWRYTSSG